MMRILKSAAVIVAALTAAALAGVPASAAADIDGLSIGTIGYNAVGNDRPWNRNAEYIDLVASAEKDITGLVVQDAWRKANPDHASKCNTFTVGVDQVDASLKNEAGDKVVLPAGHTLRVYVGSGTAKAFGWSSRIHAVYMDHGVGDTAGCGHFGHFLNNDRDTVHVTLGEASESKRYDFRRGYYVR